VMVAGMVLVRAASVSLQLTTTTRSAGHWSGRVKDSKEIIEDTCLEDRQSL